LVRNGNSIAVSVQLLHNPLSDEIFVINKGKYIGESTKGEIEYAIKIGKCVNYFESISV